MVDYFRNYFYFKKKNSTARKHNKNSSLNMFSRQKPSNRMANTGTRPEKIPL